MIDPPININARCLQRVAAITVVSYFITYAMLCWFLDLAFPGKLATQMRVRLFFDAGVASGILAFLLVRTFAFSPLVCRQGFYRLPGLGSVDGVTEAMNSRRTPP